MKELLRWTVAGFNGYGESGVVKDRDYFVERSVRRRRLSCDESCMITHEISGRVQWSTR